MFKNLNRRLRCKQLTLVFLVNKHSKTEVGRAPLPYSLFSIVYLCCNMLTVRSRFNGTHACEFLAGVVGS